MSPRMIAREALAHVPVEIPLDVDLSLSHKADYFRRRRATLGLVKRHRRTGAATAIARLERITHA